jgi:hypothetical protein
MWILVVGSFFLSVLTDVMSSMHSYSFRCLQPLVYKVLNTYSNAVIWSRILESHWVKSPHDELYYICSEVNKCLLLWYLNLLYSMQTNCHVYYLCLFKQFVGLTYTIIYIIEFKHLLLKEENVFVQSIWRIMWKSVLY